MLETFIQSFQVKNTYRVNTFIYSLKQIPILGKVFKDALYSNYALKLLGTLVSIMTEILSIFLGKFLYITIMVFAVITLYPGTSAVNFVHVLFFLTLI